MKNVHTSDHPIPDAGTGQWHQDPSLSLAEQRHRLLAEYASDVIWTMSLTGEVTYVSPAVFKLRGITPEEAMQQSLEETLTPPSQALSIQYFTDVLTAAQKGEVPKNFKGEMEYIRKDGSTFWTEVLAFPLLNEQGTLLEVLGVTRDISDRKRYEDELKASREAADKANTSKSQLVAHISHEIRTPMTAMMNYLDLALNPKTQDNTQELLTKAQDAGRLMLHLINDILDFSKMESGKLDIQADPFDLSDAVKHVTDLVAHQVQAKGLDYSVTCDTQAPQNWVGDGPRLTQALLNLVSNAVKFTEQGFVKVHVEHVATDTPHDVVLKFSVQDSGPGLSPDLCERVFDRFVQGEHHKTHHTMGTGLGLPICKQLAQLMGGDAGVTSREGQGATFWFTAHVAPLTSANLPHPSPAPNHADPAHSLEGLKVLIVDDDEAIRDSMRRLLKSQGLQVSTAADGALALALLETERFEVLLVDVQMPVMDGMTLTHNIRQQPHTQGLKIIGVSAGMLSDDKQHCLDAGMDDYLAKPFQLDDLLNKLRSHVVVTSEKSS